MNIIFATGRYYFINRFFTCILLLSCIYVLSSCQEKPKTKMYTLLDSAKFLVEVGNLEDNLEICNLAINDNP